MKRIFKLCFIYYSAPNIREDPSQVGTNKITASGINNKAADKSTSLETNTLPVPIKDNFDPKDSQTGVTKTNESFSNIEIIKSQQSEEINVPEAGQLSKNLSQEKIKTQEAGKKQETNIPPQQESKNDNFNPKDSQTANESPSNIEIIQSQQTEENNAPEAGQLSKNLPQGEIKPQEVGQSNNPETNLPPKHEPKKDNHNNKDSQFGLTATSENLSNIEIIKTQQSEENNAPEAGQLLKEREIKNPEGGNSNQPNSEIEANKEHLNTREDPEFEFTTHYPNPNNMQQRTTDLLLLDNYKEKHQNKLEANENQKVPPKKSYGQNSQEYAKLYQVNEPLKSTEVRPIIPKGGHLNTMSPDTDSIISQGGSKKEYLKKKKRGNLY